MDMLKNFVLCMMSVMAVFGFLCAVFLLFNDRLKKPPCVITVYNGEEEIEGLLRCAMLKYPRSEIYVADMGSTDETVKIIKRMSERYSRIKTVKAFYDGNGEGVITNL